jgi:tetratricopeptide (TPR) repeat protein
MLAHHTLRGELWEKAACYLRRAGAKAEARSALQDARAWLEQALGALKALPESRSTLEQAVDIRLELGYVLNLLDEVQPSLECVREAEALAERLEDDRRRGRVWASLASKLSRLGELDEALTFGTRALATARELGDLGLRSLTTTNLAQTHYYLSDYERVVELATDYLTASPADWVDKSSPSWTVRSFFDRLWLLLSLTLLGRFTEAAEQEAETIRLTELTPIPLRIGGAYFAAGTLHLLKGDWGKARLLIEHGIKAFRTGNVVYALPVAIALSAWAQAQLEARRARAEPAPGRRATPQAARDAWHSPQSRLELPRPWIAPVCSSAKSTRRGAWATMLAKLATAKRWPSPSRAACARSSPTATSASASSIAARTSASRPGSTSRPRRRCTATWA